MGQSVTEDFAEAVSGQVARVLHGIERVKLHGDPSNQGSGKPNVENKRLGRPQQEQDRRVIIAV